jgi:hypothetical protein
MEMAIGRGRKDFDYLDLLTMQTDVMLPDSTYSEWIAWRDRMQASRNEISSGLDERSPLYPLDSTLVEIYGRIILVGDKDERYSDKRRTESSVAKMNALFEAAKLIRATESEERASFQNLEDAIVALKRNARDDSSNEIRKLCNGVRDTISEMRHSASARGRISTSVLHPPESAHRVTSH